MMQRTLTLLAALALVAGCSSRDAELNQFIEQTKQEQPGGVEPLPEVKPYDSFVYDPTGLRSPFMPGTSAEAASAALRPTSRRNKEYLEQFALDALSMGGTITVKGRAYGLVKTKDKQVLQVSVGNYLGQNEGRVTKIEPSRISITEIVPDGLGGYMERATALALND
jgi:type IV pilus assembly protein PilP